MWLLLPQIAIRLQDCSVKRKNIQFLYQAAFPPTIIYVWLYLGLNIMLLKGWTKLVAISVKSQKLCCRSLSSTISTVEVLDFNRTRYINKFTVCFKCNYRVHLCYRVSCRRVIWNFDIRRIICKLFDYTKVTEHLKD